MASELLSGLKILILEDEYLIAMDVEHLCLENGAADVFIARDIETARSVRATNGFDVAVLDVMLASQSTHAFAAELMLAGVPFVFATGYGTVEDPQNLFSNVTVVGKPYAGTDLVEALAAAWQKGPRA